MAQIQESFRWLDPILPLLKQVESAGGRLVKIVAQHASIRNRNNRLYTAEEMKSAARSLSMRQLDINHGALIPSAVVAEVAGLKVPQNYALFSEFEDGRLETVAWVSDDIAKMIENGTLNKASPSGTYLDHSKNTMDTERPAQLYFDGLALLDKAHPPGDPLTNLVLDEAEKVELFTLKDEITVAGSQEPTTVSTTLTGQEAKPAEEKPPVAPDSQTPVVTEEAKNKSYDAILSRLDEIMAALKPAQTQESIPAPAPAPEAVVDKAVYFLREYIRREEERLRATFTTVQDSAKTNEKVNDTVN